MHFKNEWWVLFLVIVLLEPFHASPLYSLRIICQKCVNGGKIYPPRDPFSKCTCFCPKGFVGPRCEVPYRKEVARETLREAKERLFQAFLKHLRTMHKRIEENEHQEPGKWSKYSNKTDIKRCRFIFPCWLNSKQIDFHSRELWGCVRTNW